MSVLKLSKNDIRKNDDSENKIKLKKGQLSYDSAMISGWETTNKTSVETLNNYHTRLNNNEWMSADDLNSYRTAIDNYINTGNRLRKLGGKYTEEEEKQWNDSISSMNTTYDSVSKLHSSFKTGDDFNAWHKKETFIDAYLNDSEKAKADFEYDNSWIKEADRRKVENTVKSSEDFEEYSQKGLSIENPSAWDAQKGINLFGWKPFAEDVNNVATFARDADSKDLINTDWYKYSFMEDDEVSIYSYYLGKGDKESADKYLESLEDTLNQRCGGQIAKNTKEANLEWFMAINTGLDQYVQGVKNLDNLILGTEADPTSSIQYAGAEIREDIESDFWRGAWDLGVTVSNQLPSILVGTVTGGIGGNIAMGASVAGNAYAEMRNLGYNANQARVYSGLVTAAEMGLQYVMGGYKALGGKLSNGVTELFASKVDNALAKFAIRTAGSMLSEGAEEAIQSILEPTFKSFISGEKYDVDWDEVLYSGLLGALSAGFLEGVPNVIGAGAYAVDNYKTGKDFKKAGGNISEIASFATNTFAADTVAYKLAGKVDENTGAYQIGKLINEANATLTEANVADITKSLNRKGIEGKAAERYVNALAAVTQGYQLNEEQISALNADKAVAKTLVDVVINPNSTVNQRLQGFADSMSKAMPNSNANAETAPKGTDVSQMGVSSVEGEATQIEGTAEAVEGKTTYAGEEVSVKEISSIKDGEVIVRLEDGREVNARDVDFSSNREGLVYEAVADMSPEVARDFIDGLKAGNVGNGENQISLEHYLRGFNEAYRYGSKSIPFAEMSRKGFSAELSEQQKQIAYNRGKADAVTKVKANQSSVDAKVESAKNAQSSETAKKKSGRVTYLDGAKPIGSRQKSAVKAIEILSESIGNNWYVFSSYIEDGQRVFKDRDGVVKPAPNGMYDPDTGDIYIDLNAGKNGEGLMIFTMAHELTHFIRQWSPEKFKVFADFLLEQYGEKGVPVEQLIQAKIKNGKEKGRWKGKTEEQIYDIAYEEVIADSCETMLRDSNAMEAIAKLKAKDATIWEKIKSVISKLVAKIRAAYAKLNPDSVEGQQVLEMKEAAEKLYALWTDALVDAGEAYSAVSAENILVESGIAVNRDTDSASLMSVRDVLSDEQRDKVSTALATRFGVTKEEAIDWLKAETSMASLILNPKYSMYLDYTADPNEVAIKKNSDYPQGTVDFSNICKKRRDFTDVMNRVLRKFPNHVFEATDLAKIRTIMSEEKMEVACGICYVEDRRQLDSVVAQDFINSLALYREGSKTRPDGSPFNTNQLKALSLIDGDTYTPSIYELVSLEGRNSLKAKNPAMEQAWVKFNNARGMQSVRLLLNDAEYKRQILKYSPAVVSRKNDLGGLRIYSFSDMEMFHLIDIIQVITDSATVGLSIQGYTKVNEYAKAVKDTGEKLNRSLIPKGDLGYHMENGKVVLDYDTVEGIDINHPDFFDSTDNPNVGNIVIGINETQIKAAMGSEFIDYIIPFHTGQSKEVLGEKGIAEWHNYEDSQSERDLATGKKSSHQINIYTEVIQAAEKEGNPITNKVEFVNKFLEVCKENGLKPRFSEFLNIGKNGEYVYTEGYHKFLVDFKMFDSKTGEYLPQNPVKPIFDSEYLTSLLKDYVKSQQEKDAKLAETMPTVLERITNEIVKPDTKYSDRDSAGNTLSKEQQEYFKDSKVRDSKGRLQVVYHGTTSEFNTFKRGDIGYHFGSYAQARNRLSYQGGKKRYIKAYLDIKNPLVVEHDSGSWHGNYAAGMLLTWGDFNSNPEAVEKLQEIARMYDTRKSDVELKNFLKSLGYDGIQYLNTHESDFGKESYSYIAFDSNQVKEVTNLNPTSDPDIRYSDRETFASQVDDVLNGKFPRGNAVYVGTTPKILQDVGLNGDLPMLTTARHIRKATLPKNTKLHQHGLTDEQIKSIPEKVASPVMMMDSLNEGSNSIIVVTDMLDPDGSPVVVSIKSDGRGTYNDVEIDANFVTGYYGRDGFAGFIADNVKKDNFLYINKKKATALSAESTTSWVEQLKNYDFDTIIRKAKAFVKENSKISEDSQKFSDRDLAPTFYSQMGKVVDGMKQDKFGASSVISMLRGRGIKAEEIRWSGIATWLEGKKSVTKAELQEFIAGSQLQIGEQMSGNDIDLRYNAGDRSYTLYDNGGNVIDTYTYNEFMDGYVAESDDEIYSNANELEEAVREEYGEMSSPRWSQYKLDGGTNYRELVFTLPNSSYSNRAMKAHWGQDAEGVLVHARIQDFVTADGKMMLFIEEIQSDWHNEGHKKGYENENLPDLTLGEYRTQSNGYDIADVYDDHENNVAAIVKLKNGDGFHVDLSNGSYFGRFKTEEEALSKLKTRDNSDVPDAPFKDTYHEFVLKRLLRMAAEQGYDCIGWTPADIQSKRWSDEFAQGYRIEYDQEMPKFLKKYGRQWGAKVGYTYVRTSSVDSSYYEERIEEIERDIDQYEMELDEDNTEDYNTFIQEGISDLQNTLEVLYKERKGEKVWSMDLTDSMKGSVLHEGQVLYSDRNTSSLIGKEVMVYKEGDAKPDLTLVKLYNERTGKTETTVKFVGDKPEGYIPKKIAYCYKLFEQHPDGTLHALFAGASNATPVGEWQYAQGFPYTDSGVKGMNLRERYGWHLSAGLPSAPHLMSSKDFERGYPSKNAFGHPKGSKRVWVRMAYDASTDFNSIADSTKAGDIFGLIPFGGYYAFKENNQSEWVISSAVKIDKILTEAERQQILQEAGYDEYEAWRKKHRPTDAEKAESKRKSAENKKAKDLAKKEGKNYLSESAKEMRESIKSRIVDNPELSGIKYSDRDPDSVSNRSLLANALESAAQNDIEKNKLAQYKEKIELINSEEKKLHELREQIKEISFAKGRRDIDKLKSLQFEARQAANRINTYDRQLLTLEASKPLKDVLEREKQLAYKKAEKKGKEALAAYREKTAKTTRELITRYQESRAKATEGRHMTEYRHKIKDVVSKLNQLLLRPTKDKHVKEGLRTAVAEALSVINMDTIGADERVAKYNDLIAKTNDPDMIEELTRTRDRIELQGENLKDKLTALQSAYEKVKNSTDSELKNAYQEPVMNAIKNVVEMVGNTSLRDMSLTQLEAVYEMYSMVLHTVRTANKAFRAKKGETITQISETVNDEVRKVGKEKFTRNPIIAALRKVGWTLLKPLYAFKTIGSDTFTGLYNNLRSGEDVYYVDVNEAKTFIQAQYKKHNFKSWDLKQTKTFTAKSGKTFTLTLEQMMSLYAYSRRDQAYDHIVEGGIVLEDSVIETKNKLGLPVKYKVDTKSAFNISEETLQEICDSLTKEQRAYVEEMQAYLSDVMGAKGNEVSMELLGVKLFKEKFYFPLKSSKYYMGFKPEEAGEIKLKNPAFSKETVQHANNPVVLKNFTDVWATHINDMSMYHAFVLPLEDFTRVYNYKTRTDANLETMSTESTIANAFGEGATQYIRNFLKSLNGGVRMESVGVADKMVGLSKKGAVLGSASVMIQQPSALMRAMAHINPMHFVASTHKSINLLKHNKDWAELKRYAPIAGIKEMGRFDVGMGQSTVKWIKDQNTILENADEILSKAPAFMDEVTWVGIWNAVKNEVKHKHKELAVGSEEYLKKCGERFTEVISLTQVYDSVFSRSDIMRNQSWIAKALTAFMAEPSTTLNMLVDSFIQGKRTGKFGGFVKTTAGTTGAIVGAIVLNAALKSIITAMRDDDEDEAYAEKYLGAFVGNAMDDLNPLSYIPFVKDVVSIFKGYDVERMDMALFSDFKQAIDAMDSESKTTYEKWSGLTGAVSAFFGIPFKNVERDIRGAYNTIQSFLKGEKTTSMGIENAIKEAVTGNEISNRNQLYEAYHKDDKEQIKRVEGRFKDQSEIDSALRKALRENDSRIREAAQARVDGDMAEYKRIAKEIIAEGHFVQDIIVGAINAEINAIKREEAEK